MDQIPPLNRGIIQIAGFHDLEEATMAVDLGADVLGIPLGLTVNDEDCDISTARRIGDAFPERTCLITYYEKAKEIAELAATIHAAWIQIHGYISLKELRRLRAICPNKRIIKSLITGKFNLNELEEQAKDSSPFVDAFITDSFNPKTGAEGATGLTHDWEISRHLVNLNLRPILLAGGLNAQNVAEAIAKTQAFGVDSHTGVEDKTGRKCPNALNEFIEKSKTAFDHTEN